MKPIRVFLFALLASTIAAQTPDRPRVFAVRNARIVTVSGTTIERGTIVLRDGLIEAVGASAAVPNDAWAIDGEGLVVYPGFINGLSRLGMPDAKKFPAVYGAKPAAGPQDRPATSTWALGVDHFEADEGAVETWRNGGFTTVAVSPRQGILPGQISLLNLSRAPAEKAVAAQAAVLVQLPSERSRANGFPSSLFGQMAYVDQIFADARQARQAATIYREDPSGLERPGYDRALAPLIEAIDQNRLLLYPGDSATQIRRALERSADLADRRAVYGARQAYAKDVAAELAEASAAVLLDLDWPEAPEDPDPAVQAPLRTLRYRAEAPSSAAALAKAGVSFGLYASDAKTPADLMKGLRRAVEAGLTHEDAIRALTLGAARVYGVDDRLGSLEAGKIANLVIYRDDPFAEKSRPTTVFVDGEKFDVPAAPEDPEKDDDDS